ncbi:ATP-dependent helicase HrpB [Spongiibacter nanhainus]|uniref:ATP-dependent helicase HrpB n=1 Tax=Spongiibacter nanhainus TaxID=2794344 RepID=A0A7T4QYG3_9GAMM|nr:ATP-dependent helicase HrpB [Spongiibacter nanhainus]QQD16984.1 ATP-dependent helicase HrpB [Spongiibacter nanhainus]
MKKLPIHDVLPRLKSALADHNEVVVEAPPGAGKTTVVPLELMSEPWLAGKKILMLEPRRLAARGAAERMAQHLGESVGKRVGYRVRMESKVSSQTRIEVITEGILTRMLQDDPSLEEVGLLIFDEFHERSVDADIGLALCLEGRRLFADLREAPLKLLVMSATLEGDRLAAFLDGAPVVRSDGRQFPVSVHYTPLARRANAPRDALLNHVFNTVISALDSTDGSVLVFLPGQSEIHKLAERLRERVAAGIHIAPLYGSLDLASQRQAVAPAAEGERKVVLATNIAESSLTIEGVSVVVDSGMERRAAFDPRTGMTRLSTARISRASAEQRAGRAGRLQPGTCYRLWSEEEHGTLAAFSVPDIAVADLAPLALQVLDWGSNDPATLPWLDPPPPGALSQALDLLIALGAAEPVEGKVSLSAQGRAMASLPAHPRIARMLIWAQQNGLTKEACALAALLAEDRRGGSPVDISDYWQQVLTRQGSARRLWGQAKQFARLLGDNNGEGVSGGAVDLATVSLLLAVAFPDRIARCRESQSKDKAQDYLLSNGRAALLPDSSLAGTPWLAVAELSGQVGDARDVIRLAAPLDEEVFSGALSFLTTDQLVADWDDERQRFVAERQSRLGHLVLASRNEPTVDSELRQQAILSMIRRRGLSVLPQLEQCSQLRARVALVRAHDCSPGAWPDWSDTGLMATLEQWLLPFLNDINSLKALQRLELKDTLLAQLSWEQQQALAANAPERLPVASGNSAKIDYSNVPPVLAVKLQEMFGVQSTPRVAEGKQPLLIHLLSPAGRPLQVTQDLAAFWRNGYDSVKKEMRGRYPKHPWPDDPLTAVATAKTKRHLNN